MEYNRKKIHKKKKKTEGRTFKRKSARTILIVDEGRTYRTIRRMVLWQMLLPINISKT